MSEMYGQPNKAFSETLMAIKQFEIRANEVISTNLG